jgi:hypothetical protein
MYLPVIERLDDGDDANGINGIGAGVCKDGDEDVLLEVERPRVQREGQFFWKIEQISGQRTTI